MIYVISDIHGCYDEYLELLEKIQFSDEDELYVLGDMIDRGPKPMEVLFHMMEHPNIYPMLGNHEYMALKVLRRLNVEITEDNWETHLTIDDMNAFMHWTSDGGKETASAFTKLDLERREIVLEYLEECSLYEEIEVGGREYVLVHAGLNGFEEWKDLEEYHFTDLILYRADYGRQYYDDRYLVTGHTPTFAIHGKHEVYEKLGHIAIDCGCVFGGRLAAYCLDNGTVEYVQSNVRSS